MNDVYHCTHLWWESSSVTEFTVNKEALEIFSLVTDNGPMTPIFILSLDL